MIHKLLPPHHGGQEGHSVVISGQPLLFLVGACYAVNQHAGKQVYLFCILNYS